MEPTTSEQPEALPDATTKTSYEPMLLSGRGLRRFVVWFVLAVALTFPLIWLVMKQLMTQTPTDSPQSLIEPSEGLNTPDYALQPSTGHDALPREDLALMRARENAVFEHLGWNVDPVTGVPAIPAAVIEAVNKRAPIAGTTRPATALAVPKRDGGAP